MLGGLRHERCRPVRLPARHHLPQRPVLARWRHVIILPKPQAAEALRAAQGPDPHRGRALHLPARNVGQRQCVTTDQPEHAPSAVRSTTDGDVRPSRTRSQALLPIRPDPCQTQDGDCVCPRGTELRTAHAGRSGRNHSSADPGQIQNANGDCVCPEARRSAQRPPSGPAEAGTVHHPRPDPRRRRQLRLPARYRAARQCVPSARSPQVEQCTIRGQVHNKRGECVCPRGTEVIRGACRKPDRWNARPASR